MAPAPTHLQTSASTVRCAAPMRRVWPAREGWDLGTVTTDPARVTCPNCADLMSRPARLQRPARIGHTLGRTVGETELDHDALYRLCREAARYAVRPPTYGPDDQSDCAADVLADVLDELASEAPSMARPKDPLETPREYAVRLLAYIDGVLRTDGVRQVALQPRAGDKRVQWVALKNRATDWRRARDAQRDRDELFSEGADDRATDDRQSDRMPTRYLAAASAQDSRIALQAAREACDALGLEAGPDDAPSPAACLLFQWARDCDPEQAASELGVSWQAWRARTSRAARAIRTAYRLEDLISHLCGDPAVASRDLFTHAARDDAGRGRRANGAAHIVPAGTVIYALADGSREARNRTHALQTDWRDGTDAGDWPRRPTDATDARRVCRVTQRRPDTKAADTRRRVAARKRTLAHAKWRAGDADHARTMALGRLGYALATATGRAPRGAVGRTAGKPRETYAPRAVRLGPAAG